MEDETNSQMSLEMNDLSMTSSDSPPPPYYSERTSLEMEEEESFSVSDTPSCSGASAVIDDYDYPSVSEVRKVVLEKDSRGFGLTVAGGADSPLGVLPVFITSLDPEGVAAESGEVRLGDRIVSVNGIEMEHKSHGQVVQAIRLAGRRIVLELTEGPENIMNYLAFD